MKTFGKYPTSDNTFGVYRFRRPSPEEPVGDVVLLPEPVYEMLLRCVRAHEDEFPGVGRLRDQYRDHHYYPQEAAAVGKELERLAELPEVSEVDQELRAMASFCCVAGQEGFGVTFAGN